MTGTGISPAQDEKLAVLNPHRQLGRDDVEDFDSSKHDVAALHITDSDDGDSLEKIRTE